MILMVSRHLDQEDRICLHEIEHLTKLFKARRTSSEIILSLERRGQIASPAKLLAMH